MDLLIKRVLKLSASGEVCIGTNSSLGMCGSSTSRIFPESNLSSIFVLHRDREVSIDFSRAFPKVFRSINRTARIPVLAIDEHDNYWPMREDTPVKRGWRVHIPEGPELK